VDELARQFLNRYQGGFPIAEQPFVDIAEALETDVETLIDSIRQLLQDGTLSRFGPLYDAASMGGSITLAALSVPQERFDEVAEMVNAMPEVAHNYQREHELNMWFVIATESPELLQQAIGQIEQTANLPVYNFPKLQTFYLGLQISLDQAGNVGTQPIPGPLKQGGMIIDELDRSIVRATQEGLPVQKAPYTEIACTETACRCGTSMTTSWRNSARASAAWILSATAMNARATCRAGPITCLQWCTATTATK
jgi:DNA-binding Lrp family transcriptional regulator